MIAPAGPNGKLGADSSKEPKTIKRREFGTVLTGLAGAAALAERLAAQAAAAGIHDMVPSGSPQQVGMLLYPDHTALDLIGPHTVFGALGNADVHLLWKDNGLVKSDAGLAMQPTMTLADCPRDLDLLFVPGGLKGTTAMMGDRQVLAFLRDRGSRAKLVTSVCTGSLVLAAAGLLRGYKATSHWTVLDLLSLLEATPVGQRVVEDRNRITGAGVTAGIDFAFTVSAKLRGEEYAKMLQLLFEYDPQPPFHAGSPASAGPALTEHLKQRRAEPVKGARAAAEAARRQWPA